MISFEATAKRAPISGQRALVSNGTMARLVLHEGTHLRRHAALSRVCRRETSVCGVFTSRRRLLLSAYSILVSRGRRGGVVSKTHVIRLHTELIEHAGNVLKYTNTYPLKPKPNITNRNN